MKNIPNILLDLQSLWRFFMMISFSVLSIGVLTSQCLTTYPNAESFETDLGIWVESTTNNFGWTRTDMSTPTAGTGPVAAMHGSYFLYADAANNPNSSTALETCVDLENYCTANIEFNYHMLGADIGQLVLEASTNNGLTWTNLWSENNDQGISWYVAKIDLTAYAGSRALLRFTASNNGLQGDIALDNVRVRAFHQARILDITKVDPVCELENGEISINFDDVINVDSIRFSIDGGNTWTAPVADNSGSIDFPSLGPGTYDLWVKNNVDDCPVDLADQTLTNQASPNVTFSMSDADYCDSDGVVTLTGGSPAGGTYTGPAVSGGVFSPTNAGAGIHTITYTVTDANGCSGTSTQDLVVHATPVVDLTLDIDIDCAYNTSLVLSGGLPVIGGSYVGAGVTGTNFDASVAGVGTHIITYTFTDSNGCTAKASDDISVFQKPNVALTLTETEDCDNNTALLLSGGIPVGGIYSGAGVTGTNFDASVAGIGTHTITYTYTDGNGCENYAEDEIEVFGQPNVTFNLADNMTCVTEMGYDLSGSVSPSGGTFSGTGVTGNLFDANVAGIGVHTLTYTYIDSNGCENAASYDMNVVDLPTVTFSLADDATCETESGYDLSGSVSPAGGYFFGTGVTGNLFDANVAGVGTHTLTYGYTDSNGCNDEVEVEMTVYALPAVSLSLGKTTSCDNETTLALTDGLPSGGTYSGAGVSGNNFDASTAGVGVHIITYSYTDGNGCTSTATDDIAVYSTTAASLTLVTDSDCISNSALVLAGGFPSGGTYSGVGVTGTNFDASLAGIGTHTITYTFTNANGCEAEATDDIIVNDIPSVTLALVSDETCVTNTALALAGGTPVGGSYSGPGVTGNSFDASAVGIGVHIITYTYVDGNGCENTATDAIEVFELPTVSLSLPQSTDCSSNNNLALSGGIPSGGTFSGLGVTATNFDASAAGVGTHTISYTYTDANGCTNVATEDIQVFALPNVSLTLADDSDCEDNTTLLLAGGMPAGGTYSGPGVVGTNFDASVAGLGTHTISYTYIDGNGCENTATDELTVHSLTIVDLSLSTDELCEDVVGINLSGGIPSGGTYTGTGVSGTWFDVAAAGVGSHTITYTYTDPAGCINSATDVMTVHALPSVMLTLDDGETCVDETLTLSGASPAGGSFSGDGVTGTTFDAAVAGIGTHTITYTYTDGNGCTSSATDFVEVYGLPSVELNLADDNECETSTALSLSGGIPTGGVYSGPAVTGSTFSPSVAGIGVHTISYTYTDGNGCVATATDEVTVYALPTVALALSQADACADELGFTLEGGSPAGGSYSGTGVSGNYFDITIAGVGIHTVTYTYTDPVSGCDKSASQDVEIYNTPNVELFLTDDEDCSYNTTLTLSGGTPFGGSYSGPGVTGGNFDATAAGIGTHTITYSYTDVNGCTDTATDQLVVNPETWVGLTLTDDTECNNSTIRELTEGLPAGGTYSGPGVSGTNFDANVAGVGVHTITYSFTDTAGCTYSASDDITVSEPPVVSLTLVTDDACADDTGFNLAGGSPAGGTWSGTGVSGNYFDVATAGSGVHSITYTYTDPSSGCSNSATQNISIYSLPNVALSFVDDQLCVSNTTFALTEGLPSGGTYTGPGVTGANFDASAAGIGTHTITYTYIDSNGCQNATTDDITVNALPSVALSLASSVFCLNDSDQVLSGGAPAGGNYTGAGITANTLSPSAAGVGTHIVTYTYTDSNGCENTATQNITINNIPTVSLALTDTDACLNETIHPLDGASPAGGNFSGPGVSGSNFSPTVAGLGVHTITYTYIDGNGCPNTATDVITVTNVSSPVLNLGEDEACVSASGITLTGGSPAGGTWSGAGVTGNSFDPSIAGIGTHTITYSFTSGSCYAEATDQFTVYAQPTPTLTLSDTELCIGERMILSGESPTGGTWSGPGVSGNRFRSAVAGLGVHTITYTYTDANGCTGSVTDEVTVYDLPIVTLNLPVVEDCENNTTLVLSGGSPAGGTYSGNGVTGTNFDASAAGDGTHAITYTYIDANGCENSAVQNISVYTVPDVAVNLEVNEACIDGSAVTLRTGRPLGGVWSGPGVTGNQLNPSAAGIGVHTITYSFTINGCTNSETGQFTVNALPTVTLNLQELDYCLGENVSLTGGMPSGGSYSGPGVDSNTGSFNTVIAGLGTHTITYDYIDANGCAASTSQDVTVYDLPAANLSLVTDTGCATDANIPLAGGSPAGGVYSGSGVTGNSLDATHPSVGQGVHTIYYTYTDANGCEAVAIDEMTIYSSPDVSFTYQDENCGKNDGSISFSFTNNSDIFWIEFSLDGGANWQSAVRDNTGGVTYNFLSAGTYDLVVRNANGSCEHNVGTAVIENINGPTANAGPDVTINPPATTTLNASGGNFYKWTPANGLSNTSIPNPVAAPQQTRTYTLEVTDLNGCKDTDQVTVTVEAPCAGSLTDGDYPYRESFESGMGLWSQEAGDDFDWTRDSGGTPTASTGPSLGSDGTWYMYAEADGNNNQTAIFKSPCFDLYDQSCAQFSFDYHMYGSTMGSIRVEASIDFGQSWTTVWPISGTASGNQGNIWNSAVLDLFGYVGQSLQLRIIANIGNGNTSDIAIDNVEFITTGCGCADTSSPFENFNLVPDPQPFSIDIDCDGDADMLAGGDGELFFFENNGDGTYTDQTGTANDIMPGLTHLDMTLGFCDLDGDGDYDMSIVGNEAYNKRFYWNTGTKTDPVFTLAGTNGTPTSPIQGFDFSIIDGGQWIGYADPTIFWVDLDGDNDFDAVIGGKLGWFLYYENIGDENNPNLVARVGSANPFNGLRADGEDEGTPTNPCPGSSRCQYESAPLLIDWDGDGDYDMFSGNQISTVQYFENIGTATNPNFVEVIGTNNPFDGVIFSEDSHIEIIDEDCDGDWDVFYGVGDSPDDAEITLCDLLVAVPNAAIPVSDQTHYCEGATAYFNEAGTTGISWEWEGPNGFTSTLQNPVIPNLTELAEGTYSVTVTNPQGCPHVNSIDITVSNGSADAGIDVCIEQGESTPLNGSGVGVNFSWSPSTGLSNPSILNPTATPNTTTTYVLTVTDFYGCRATDEVTIIVKSDICEEEANIFEADFENTTGDNLWTMNTAAADGDFEIGVPYPYYTAGNLMELTAHSGTQSLLTGNNFGQDLDGGPATARSRNIVISPTATNVDLSFYWYMSHAYNGNSADYLRIEIRDASNGTTLSTLVNEIGSPVNRPAEWTFYNTNLVAHAGKTIYIWVDAADYPNGSKMEAAVDDISITETFETIATFMMSDVDYCEEDPVVTLSGGMPVGGVYSGPGVVGNTFDPGVAGPGVHPITYQYTTLTGCIATAGTAVEVFELPLVEVDLSVPEACDTETSVALFGGLPTGGTYSGTGVTGSTMNPNVAGAGSHIITYTVTDANGCENSSTDTFVVVSSPVVTAVNSVNASCELENGSITIEFDDVAGITNLEFSLDGGLTWETAVPDSDGSVTYSDLSVGTYDVWVRNADADCELDLADAIIIDEPSPQVDAGLDQTVCDGLSVSTTATTIGGTAPLSYAWSGPGNFTSNALTITMATEGTYIITVTDDNGCTATDAVYLKYISLEPGQIREPDIACPANDPDLIESIEPGVSCNKLDNHEFIHDLTDNWFLFQNSAASASLSIDTNSELSGENSAFVDVTTVTGTDWHVMLVQQFGTIHADETYEFTFEAKADAPKTIQVQMQEAQSPWTNFGLQTFNIGTTASTYTWSGIAPNVDHNNVKFQFRLGGDDTDIWIDNTVLQPSSCTNEIIEYSWECRESDGAGGWSAWTAIAGATAESYDPPAITNIKEYRRIASVQGCNDYELSNIVTVELCPCTVVADGDDTICPGEAVALTATGTGVGNLSYAWLPVTGLDDASIANPIASPTTTTTYTVTMTDASGCMVTDEVTITVTPEVIADATGGQILCIDEDAQLVATGGDFYFWSPPTGLSNPNIPNPIASPDVTTTYTVTVTDINGCTDTAEAVVTIFNRIENIVVSSEDASCGDDNGSITITWTTPAGITDIAFSLDGGVTFQAAIAASDGTVTYSNLASGSYDLQVKRNDDTCLEDISDVVISDQPTPLVVAGADVEICAGDNVTITPTVTSGTTPYTYAWEGPAGMTASTLDLTVFTEGNYIITVTDNNGCTTTDLVMVTVLDPEPGQIVQPTIDCPSNDPGIITSLEPGSACNIISNHEFDAGTSSWNPYVHADATATMTIDNNGVLSGDNSLYVDITAASGTGWHIMPYHVVGAVQASETYELSFDAVAAANKNIRVELQEAQAPFTTYASTTIAVGTTPNTYTWSAIAPGVDHNNIRLVFIVGDDDINIWLDNAVLEETGCAEPVIEYQWECRESDGAGGWNAWTTIPAATAISYDPPVQTVDKQYRRLTSVLGCSTATESIEVTVELCPCTIDAGTDAEICIGESTLLEANGTGVGTLSYAWSPAASLSATNLSNPLASPDATTTYTVTVSDVNGCTATDDVLVTVQDTTEIYCERYRLRYGTSWQPWIPFTGDCVIELCEDSDLNDFQFDGGPNIDTGWVWTDEDGNIDPEVDEIVAFGNIGLNDAGIYTGELTNANGCVSRLEFEVIVHPNVIADAGPNQSYCEGADPVMLTASGGTTYLWDDAAGSMTATISVNPAVTTTYTVTVTNGECSDTDQVTVTVFPNPTAEAGADDEFCEGEETQLMATGGDSYVWSPAAGLSNANIANPLASPVVTTTYTVTVTDANGCTDTDELTITIQEAPEVTGVAHTDTSCGLDNGEITITFNDVVGIENIQFSLDGGVTWETAVADADGTVTYSDLPAGTYDLWVRKANGFCVIDISDVTIIALSEVQVELGPEQEVCPGVSGTFTASATNGNPSYTYSWEGPANFTSTDQSITVTQEGAYVVTVTDANGCTATDITALQVLNIEGGQIATPTMECPQNDPGIITSIEDPSACNYIANHEANNGIAGWYLWNNVAEVNPLATISVDNSGVLSGDNSMYFDLQDSGVSWWTQLIFFSNEYIAGESYTISFEAMAEAPRDITIVTNLGHSPYTQYWNQTITLGTTPNTYSFTINPTESVENLRLSFFIAQSDVNFWLDNMVFENNNCVEPSFEYEWQCRESDGAGGWTAWTTIPGATNSSYDPPVQTTTKQFRRQANLLGCTSTALSNEVEVEICPCEIDAGDDETICFGGSTTLSPSATGVGALSYTWSPVTDLDDANIESPVATPSVTTTYTVTVTDENGCTSSGDVVITVEQSNFADAGVDQTICDGSSADLLASGGVSYVWNDPSGATTANVTVTPAASTTYTVTVTDVDGCIDTDEVTINLEPAPTVTVGDQVICADEVATLTSTITGGLGSVTYQWQKSHGGTIWNDIPGATSSTYTTDPLIGTSYFRLVTTWTECGEVHSNTATVTVEPASQVANVVAGEDTLCIGESTILTVNDGIQNGGLIDYTSWTSGTGNVAGFNQAGNVADNNRKTDLDPWGNSVTVWEANRVDNGRVDGGWNTSRFDVDHTQTYRYSVWVNRKVLSTDGRLYVGTRGFGSVDGVERLNGVVTTNPYFLVTVDPPNEFAEDQWVLVVGHVHPSGSTNTTRHADSGIYSLCEGRITNVDSDFRWLAETVQSLHRVFLYDDDDENAVQQYVYPRVDVIDGTEPSIDELLHGFDATNGLGDGATYEWFTGSCGGTPVGVGPTLPVTPTVTTTYYVRATGSCGTTDCEEVTVVVNNPQVTITEPTDSCVNGDDITITATPAPGTVSGDTGVYTPMTGLTDNGDGTATIDVDVAGVGSHSVTYTYTDGNGCIAMETTTFSLLDTPTADAGADVEICEGEGIQLSGSGGVSYEWSPAAGLSDPNIANPTASPTVTTTYTLTVTNADGCTATDEVTVTVNESLDASAVALSHDLCEDGTGEATVTITNGVGPFTIEWMSTDGIENGSGNLPTIGDFTITGLNGGTTYCIGVTDSNGCKVTSP